MKKEYGRVQAFTIPGLWSQSPDPSQKPCLERHLSLKKQNAALQNLSQPLGVLGQWNEEPHSPFIFSPLLLLKHILAEAGRHVYQRGATLPQSVASGQDPEEPSQKKSDRCRY